MSKKIQLIFLLLFLIPFAYSQYYADITIKVSDTGLVTIDGKTNHEELKQIIDSSNYTSKEKNIWTFNLSLEENFDNYIYELNLPQNSQITYIKTTPTFRIVNDNNNIKLIGTGENRKLIILVQYTIDNSNETFLSKYWTIITGITILILLIISGLLLLLRKKNNNEVENNNVEKKEIDFNRFTDRQQEIIKLLQKHNKLTQKELEKHMKIPKSSISRNIRSLELKGIIIKENVGQSNYIKLQ